jgi:hypothetical protein
MTYIKLPITSGGSGGTSDDIMNLSGVAGTNVTQALDNTATEVTNVVNIQATTQYKNQTITLSATDILNEYILLTDAPVTKNTTQLFIVGNGSPQVYGTDFIVTTQDSGKRLTWLGLTLESLLEENDTLVILYN